MDLFLHCPASNAGSHLKYEITADYAGFIFLASLAVYILGSPVAGKLADKFPQHNLLTISVGLFIVSIGYLLIGPSSALDRILPNK